jgi:hypothetical protein
MKNEVMDAFAQEHLSVNRSGGAASANKFARERTDDWDNPSSRARTVSGKQVISRLSAWAKRNYNVSFGPETIASEMHARELPPEIAEVVTAIHEGEHFHNS